MALMPPSENNSKGNVFVKNMMHRAQSVCSTENKRSIKIEVKSGIRKPFQAKVHHGSDNI